MPSSILTQLMKEKEGGKELGSGVREWGNKLKEREALHLGPALKCSPSTVEELNVCQVGPGEPEMESAFKEEMEGQVTEFVSNLLQQIS